MRSAREVARLIGVEKSPILNHYGESIAGAATIRSFGLDQQFMDTNLELFDNYSRPCFTNAGMMEWLVFRMELLCSLVFSLSMVLVVLLPDGAISPSKLSVWFLNVKNVRPKVGAFLIDFSLVIWHHLCVGLVQVWVDLQSHMDWIWMWIELCGTCVNYRQRLLQLSESNNTLVFQVKLLWWLKRNAHPQHGHHVEPSSLKIYRSVCTAVCAHPNWNWDIKITELHPFFFWVENFNFPILQFLCYF